MRKRLPLIALVVCMLLVLCASFAACDFGKRQIIINPDNSINAGGSQGGGENESGGNGGGDEGGDETSITSKEALDKMIGSLSGNENEVASIMANFDVKVGETPYRLNFGSNVKDTVNLAATLTDNDGKTLFGFYIHNNRFYLDFGDTLLGQNPKVYLEDFDADYILNLAGKIPSLDELLNSIGGSLPIDLSSIIYGSLFQVNSYKVNGSTESIDMKVAVYDVIMLVLMLVNGLDLPGLLQSAGVRLPSGFDLGEILNSIVIPYFDINVKSVIKEGKMDAFDVSIVDAEGGNIFDIDSSFELTENRVEEIGIPSDIASFVPISLTNLSVNAVLDLQGNDLDVGAIVNMIAASNVLPAGALMLNAEMFITAKVQIDLDLNDNSKNMVLLEFYNGEEKVENRLIGVYYYKGELMVNVSEMLSFLNIPNIKVTDIDITEQLQKLVALISAAIDPQAAAVSPSVLSVATAAEGDYVISPDISSFINGLLGMLEFEENLIVSGNQISLIIDKAFIEKILDMIMSFDPIPDPENPGEFLPNPSRPVIPEFGRAQLDVNLSQYGIDNVNLHYQAPSGIDAQLNLNLNGFLVGYAPVGIEENISQAIDGKEYVTNVKDMIYALTDGISAAVNFDVTLKAGEYNVMDLVNGFMTEKMPPLYWTFTEDFVMNLKLDFRFSLDRENPANTKAFLELHVLNDNFPLAPKGLLMGIYYENNTAYIDLSHIKIANMTFPKLFIDVKLADKLIELIETLQFNFLLEDILNMISPSSGALAAGINETQTLANLTASEFLGIAVDINPESLKLRASLNAVMALLQSFGVDLAIELPDFDISLEVNKEKPLQISLASTDKAFSAYLGVSKLSIGSPVEIGFPPFDKTEYSTKVLSSFIDKLMHVDIDATFAVNTEATVFSIQNLINNIMLADGQKFNIPIDLNLYEYSNVINARLKWNLDKNDPKNSEALFEIRTDRGNFFIGIYISKGNLYVDLKELGFFKFGVENSVLVEKIIDLIYGAVANIEIDLTEVVNGLFAGAPQSLSLLSEQENTGAIFPDYSFTPEMETVDLIELILSSVKITDLNVGVDLTKEVMYQLMLALGVDLGMDITANIDVDIMNGKISGNVDLDMANMDFEISINNIGNNDPINFASGFFTGYAGIDTTTGEVFADTLLNALDLELWIDINSKNVDTGGSDYPSRLRIYKTPIAKTIFKGGSINVIGISASSYGPLTASAGSIIVELYYEHKNSTPQIVIVLDPNEKQLKIGAADSFLTVNIQISKIKAGGAIRINVALDIKAALMGLYDTLFGENGFLAPTKKAQPVAVMAAAGGGGIGDLVGEVNIEQLISRIDLSILPTDNLKAQIKLNGRKVNELLTNLLTGLFPMLADMGIDMSSMGLDASVFKNVKYDNLNANVFVDSLYDNVVKPLVVNMVGGSLYNIAQGDISWTVKNLIKHFLPLPAFTDLAAEVNIIDGRLCNIKIDGDDTDHNNYMKIHIYNQKIFTQEIQQVVDWGSQDTHITYDPYNDEANDVTKYFVKSVIASSQTDMVGGATNHVVNIDWDFSALLKDENGLYIPGTYIVRGVGANDNKVSLDVTVKVLDMPAIESIEEVRANPYDALPDKIVAVFAGGVKREINNVVIDAAPETYREHTVIGKVTLRSVAYDVPVHYTDNTIALVYNAPIAIDPYSYQMALTQFPAQLFVAFENGRRYVMDATWDLSNLTNLTSEQWAKGGDYIVYATVNQNGVEQTIEQKVTVLCKELAKVQINSIDNVFELDPYLYVLEGESVYPTSVRAFYSDGTSELVPITWSGAVNYTYTGSDQKRTISFTTGDVVWEQEITVRLLEKKIFNIVFEDNNTMFRINPFELLEKGESLFPTIASVHFTDGSDMLLPIRWNAADIQMLIDNFSFEERFHLLHVEFGFEVEGMLQDKLVRVANTRAVLEGLKDASVTVDPLTYLYEGKNPYPAEMEFLTDRGETLTLPVVWDASKVDITLGGGSYEASVSVGSGAYKQVFAVTVNVEARRITGTPQDTFVLDIAEYIDKGFDVYPPEWQFYFGETLLTLAIEWTDIENILMRPGEYEAEVIIGKGTPAAQKYTLIVQVVDSRVQAA